MRFAHTWVAGAGVAGSEEALLVQRREAVAEHTPLLKTMQYLSIDKGSMQCHKTRAGNGVRSSVSLHLQRGQGHVVRGSRKRGEILAKWTPLEQL